MYNIHQELQARLACRASEPAAGVPHELGICAEQVASGQVQESSSHDPGSTGTRSPVGPACEAAPAALTSQSSRDSDAVPERQQQQQHKVVYRPAHDIVVVNPDSISSHPIDCSNRCSVDVEDAQQLSQTMAASDAGMPLDVSTSVINASHKPGIQASDEEGSASASHSEFSATAAPHVQPPQPAAGTYTRALHGMAASRVAAEHQQLACGMQQTSSNDEGHATPLQASAAADMAAAHMALEAALKQQAEQAAAREAAARAQVCSSLLLWCKQTLSTACRVVSSCYRLPCCSE